MTAPIPQMESVAIPPALSRPEYQITQTQLARQLADYKAQQGLEASQYGGQYDQQVRRLGRNQTANRWDPTIPNSQYGMAVDTNANDYAGRGMTHSGANLKARADINSDFDDRLAQLDITRKDFADTQAQSLLAFSSQQEAVRQQAQAAAIATLAAKYGIDLDQVPLSGGTTIQREAL